MNPSRGFHWDWDPTGPKANLVGAGGFAFAVGASERSNTARVPRSQSPNHSRADIQPYNTPTYSCDIAHLYHSM